MTKLWHLLRVLITLFLVLGCTVARAETRQEHVHHMGHDVMPFDLAKTTHIFRMTDSGGVERVIVKNASDKDQVALVQKHLQHEAEAFQRGDYSDPISLHGDEMPGLKELQTEAEQISVRYSVLPNGAEITFETADLHLLTAIHRWFGAQLSEHGADAVSE
ncbi:MAG: aspartate carbamoyltransferase [Gallionella sp.]